MDSIEDVERREDLDSSFAGSLDLDGFAKGPGAELSGFSQSLQAEDGENQLDQCIVEDNSQDHAETAGGLGDFLKDEIEQQYEEENEDMRKVHKFDKPILSEEEIVGARVKVRAQAGKPAKDFEEPEKEKEASQTTYEDAAVNSSWRCSACMKSEDVAQQYCSLL